MKLQNKLSIFYSFPLACVMHLFQCPCLKLVCWLWQNNHKNIRFFQFVLWNHNRCKLIIVLIYCNIKRHIQLMTLVPYCNFNAMTLTLMKSFRKYFIDEKSRLAEYNIIDVILLTYSSIIITTQHRLPKVLKLRGLIKSILSPKV